MEATITIHAPLLVEFLLGKSTLPRGLIAMQEDVGIQRRICERSRLVPREPLHRPTAIAAQRIEESALAR